MFHLDSAIRKKKRKHHRDLPKAEVCSIAELKFHPLKSIFLEIGNFSYRCPRFPFELLRISLKSKAFIQAQVAHGPVSLA